MPAVSAVAFWNVRPGILRRDRIEIAKRLEVDDDGGGGRRPATEKNGRREREGAKMPYHVSLPSDDATKKARH